MSRRRLFATALGISILCAQATGSHSEPSESAPAKKTLSSDSQLRSQRTSGGEKSEQLWLERLNKADATAASKAAGWAAPPFPEDARWFSGTGPEPEDLRGRVVVIQTMSNLN